MTVDFSPAFILHQRVFRESSLLLDIVSRDYGRISLVAKGVRKQKRSQAGLLQIYQPLLLSWQGRRDLQTLTAVESNGPAYLLRGESALCGLYINELMMKLLPLGEPEVNLYIDYQKALFGLQEALQNEITLRLFEKQLLGHLGYGLVLDQDVETGESIDKEKDYY